MLQLSYMLQLSASYPRYPSCRSSIRDAPAVGDALAIEDAVGDATAVKDVPAVADEPAVGDVPAFGKMLQLSEIVRSSCRRSSALVVGDPPL